MNINLTNYEEYLINKLEGLLNREETAELDSFMLIHPELLAEWETLKQTVLVADGAIVFTDKASLKKTERERRVVPLYRNLLIATSVAASLLLVVYIGVFKFNKPDSPVTIASTQTSSRLSLSSGNESPVMDVHSTQLTAQNLSDRSLTASSHRTTQHYHSFTASAGNTPQPDVQSTSSSAVPVELASLNPLQGSVLPLKPTISLTPYMPITSNGETTASINVQPERTNEHASWIQFASVVGSELYRLSGRGELSTGKQKAPARNNVSVSVNTKRFSFLKTFHFHHKHKTIQSK